jgi:hypothetical protein
MVSLNRIFFDQSRARIFVVVYGYGYGYGRPVETLLATVRVGVRDIYINVRLSLFFTN